MKKQYVYKHLFVIILILLFTFGIEGNQEFKTEARVEETPWENMEDGNKKLAVFTTGLDKGVYQGFFSMDAQEDGTWKLIDTLKNNGEGQLGKEIASGTIEKGNTKQNLTFSLTERVEKLSLEVYAEQGAISVDYWKLQCTEDGYKDSVLLFLTILLSVYVLAWLKKKKEYMVIAAISVGVFLSLPCFFEPLYYGHDIAFHMNRIIGIADAMQQGQFPVRMNYMFNQGYGFINPTLYPELFLYIPAILYMLGVSAMTAYKFLVILINIGGAIIGYISFKKLFRSDKMGCVCMAVYMLIPYRIANIYTRAAIGEALASVFLPLLLLGVYELFVRDYKKWYLIVIAGTGIVQSHILSVEISIGFVLFAFLISLKNILRKKEGIRIWYTVKAGCSVLALNLWFIIPFVEQFGKKYALLESRSELYTTAVPLWNMFFSNTGLLNRIPLSLGLLQLVGAVLFLYYALYRKQLEETSRRLGFICLGFGGVSCYMASTLFPWRMIQEHPLGNQIMAAMQFPWRMLSFSGVFLSVVTAIALKKLWEERQKAVLAALCLLSVQSVVSCIDEIFTNAGVYLWNRDSIVASAGYNDYYKEDFNIAHIYGRGDRVETEAEVDISQYEKEGGTLNFKFVKKNPEERVCFLLPYYNYGGYRAFINGQEVPVGTDDIDMVLVAVPEGIQEGTVEVKYYGRKLYRAGDFISVLSAAGIMGNYVYKKGKKKKHGFTKSESTIVGTRFL